MSYYQNSYSAGDTFTDFQGNKYTVVTGGNTPSTPFDSSNIVNDLIVWGDLELEPVAEGGTGQGLVDYEANKSYSVGDIVIYDDKIYKCITAHTSTSTFDDTKWEEISPSDKGLSIWESNTIYNVDDIVIDSNLIWKCVVSHTSTSTFDESKWICISGGEISNGMEIVPLWEGTLRFNDTSLQQLADNVTNYDYLIFTIGSDPTNNAGSSISELIDIKNLLVTNYYRVFGGHPTYSFQAEIKFNNDYTHFYVDGYVESNGISAYIYKVQGIRQAKPIVSSGMKYETLWSGSVGDISGVFVDVSINLSEPVTKFKKIGFEIVAKDDSGSTSYRNYYEEVPVEQIVNVIYDSNQKLMFTLGYSSWSNYIMVNHSGTALSTLSMEGQRTLLKKVIGISEGVQIPTGVQAANVTLWEGQGTQGQTLTLSDDYSNYDLIIMYSSDAQDAVLAIGQIEPSKELTCFSSYYNGTLFINVCDFSNNTATVTYAANMYVKRIVGIKYIQPDSYSTEEKLIGTWIDGKPLYRRVFENPTNNLNTGLSNNVNVVSCYGACYNNYGDFIPIPYADTDYFIACRVLSSGNLGISTSHGVVIVSFKYIAIEYTKN